MLKYIKVANSNHCHVLNENENAMCNPRIRSRGKEQLSVIPSGYRICTECNAVLEWKKQRENGTLK